MNRLTKSMPDEIKDLIRVSKKAYNAGWTFGDIIRNVITWAYEHPNNPWISVDEELPEEGQIVFVHMQGGACDSALYTSGAFERSLQLKFGMKDEGYTIISWEQKFKSNITHWMPIPETPKGGEG